jgi:hypothetical protein
MPSEGNQHPHSRITAVHRRKLALVWRALVEVGFIIFLFYSNLLMGDFTRSRDGQGMTLIFAIHDVFTVANFEIGFVCALIGFVVFEFLRKRL